MAKMAPAINQYRAAYMCPIEVVFQELSVTQWHDLWWRQVLSYWNAMPQADSGSIINIVLHDAIAIAQNGCSYGWAAERRKLWPRCVWVRRPCASG